MSDAEKIFETFLLERKIRFRSQHHVFAEIVGDGKGVRERLKKAGYQNWVVDFTFKKKTYLEIQGHGWGHSGKGAIRDWQKHNALSILGWRGLYFPAFTVEDRPDIVLETLEELWK